MHMMPDMFSGSKELGSLSDWISSGMTRYMLILYPTAEKSCWNRSIILWAK